VGEKNVCIYCPKAGDSLEHPLLAAFGEFKNAPLLKDRLCSDCNNRRLGLLDEQYIRSGPEAFLRRFYGVKGRTGQESVNVFERGSAGGRRLEMKAMDSKLGIEVLSECSNGTYRQMRQLVFVEKEGTTKHLPIREGTTVEQLRTAYQRLNVTKPFDVHLLYDPETELWVESLVKGVFPPAQFGEGTLASTSYSNAVIDISITDRYFRALVKMGFHYFLTQFPEFTGREEAFAEIRHFILENDGGIAAVDNFVKIREHPLLGAMLIPGLRPNGWRGHILSAEIASGQCLAYVQTFISEDWLAPIYAIELANNVTFAGTRSKAHAYLYYGNGPEGNYVGDAFELETMHVDGSPPARFSPVIMPA
jgi:hypothetical protein